MGGYKGRVDSYTALSLSRLSAGSEGLGGAVYRTIGNEKRLYVQAPTGIGKTLSTLFPSIKAMTGHRLDKLFYLTAKTVTRTVAQEAAEQMLSGGLRLKSLTLRAKDKICFCETPRCNPIDCPYAKGHYDPDQRRPVGAFACERSYHSRRGRGRRPRAPRLSL